MLVDIAPTKMYTLVSENICTIISVYYKEINMRILSIEFVNDELLGSLVLNLSDPSDTPLDTIIFAGENGCGKTSILEAIYKFSELDLVPSNGRKNKSITITYQIPNYQLEQISEQAEGLPKNIKNAINGVVSIKKDFSVSTYNYSQYIIHFDYPSAQGLSSFTGPISGIFHHDDIKSLFATSFSTVEINYNPSRVSSVTSKDVDSTILKSSRSSGNIATEIKQLFVDIQNNDAIELSEWVHEHPGEIPPEEVIDRRIKRFNNAFSFIFDSLRFKTIHTQNGEKQVIFSKNDREIPIEALSSGEKQIVFRGAFLLKDIQSTKGRIVLIDEPEISLHPNWQIKILDFYKNLFVDENHKQTSQVLVATHSPFVVHNQNRKNDKVVVLQRNNAGSISVVDHPEYYDCSSTKVIEDAFQDTIFVSHIENEEQTVFLEGRTDEKYFNKAAEVFDYSNLPFKFKWVGYLDDSGNEVNTGKDSLGKAAHFLISLNRSVKTVCLFDCDTSRNESEKNNVICYALNTYQNEKGIKKGIENALVLDNIDLQPYYFSKTKYGDYGEEKTITEFNKMLCCDSLCSMDFDTLKVVFGNLKVEIDRLITKFSQ